MSELPPLFASSAPDDLSSHRHRQLVGALGLLLPLLLWLIAGIRHTEGLAQWIPLDSVSSYYYTGAVSAFVGLLITLACCLFTYEGYANEYGMLDRVAALVAGLAAVGVAFFPAGAPDNLKAPSWWTKSTGMLHYASAVVLFSAFIFFALFLFPKSKSQGKSLPREKRRRNNIYRCCGGAMLLCMVWAGSALVTKGPVFLPESLALVFFATAWLVKGRAGHTAASVTRRALHYGRHPAQLVGDVRKAMQARRLGRARPMAAQTPQLGTGPG
jgi:hypothetical protein